MGEIGHPLELLGKGFKLKKLLILFVLGLLCLFSTNVQANHSDEGKSANLVKWEEILSKAHDIQTLYTQKPVEYHYIREDFLQVFTEELMIEMFKEHLLVLEKGYQFASTDFSPYMIHSLDTKKFEVISVTDAGLILEESIPVFSELMGTNIPQQRITVVKTENGTKISKVNWILPEQ
ncbi:hypothetical protein [Pontibacillus yanchengensis]|uniref:DUF3993 domain-containing protein n=1 Tax=Pontibacillus yanchengensis Y32 TaxID=1385514 RepID=A0A0A2T6P8_9BACI|nr:hypothetical protein [Pontibacillus yanchengensis]KGP71457.1 hypothetical protein N782_19370 [Pontibacillus yanchengensis Y32]